MSTQAKNKAIVLEAFDTLFNQRDYAKAETFWSPAYIQHSAHIEPGREGLFKLIRSLPDTLKYEHGVIMAEGDFVMIHGRFSGNGDAAAFLLHYTRSPRYGADKDHPRLGAPTLNALQRLAAGCR